MKRTLVVFAKEPEEGRVKTRMSGVLTEGQCVELYKAFLADTLVLAGKAACEERVLAFEAVGQPNYIKSVAGEMSIMEQKGDDLGEKMYNAMADATEAGADRTVIIGSDAPTLPTAYIEEAFVLLGEHDVVAGPASDGGYYLIGMRTPHREIFRDVDWSGDEVLRKTRENAERAGLTMAHLKEWYDVDDGADIARLKDDIDKAPNTALALNNIRRDGGKI